MTEKNEEHGNKLRTYRKYKTPLSTSDYMKGIQCLRHRQNILRCGSLSLEIETGIYFKPKINLNDRLRTFTQA